MERTHRKKQSSLLFILFLSSGISIAPGVLGTLPEGSVSLHQTFLLYPPDITSLQDAINQATPEATIQLPAGTFNEILTIDKPLHLKGQGATQTILCPTSPANGYAVRIIAEGVTLSDLAISNLGPGLYTTAVKISAANTTIHNCTFHDTPIGIAVWRSYNTISGCQFRGCGDEGIVLFGTSTTPCTNTKITSCVFSENCDGIELQYATYNLITSCSFIQNSHAGIDAIASNNNNNIISYCTFINNQAFGLYLTRSSHNVITQCLFSDDTITLVQASNTTLSKSQGAHIHLLKDSILRIEQCTDIDQSDIISQQSSYEIQPSSSQQVNKEKTTYLVFYLKQLQNLFSRFKILKSLYEQLIHVRT